jgi:hypothetical protein
MQELSVQSIDTVQQVAEDNDIEDRLSTVLVDVLIRRFGSDTTSILGLGPM